MAQAIAVRNVSYEYGTDIGRVLAVRCGKTTTLDMLAGFLQPTQGGIHVDGRDVSGNGL